MFESITIHNLRAITQLELNNLGQVNLLVGQNNCGKTTILEALFFLVGATNPGLPNTVNQLRGFPFLSNEVIATFWHNKKIIEPIKISGVIRQNMERRNLSIFPLYSEKQETQRVSSDFVTIETDTNDRKPQVAPDGLKFEYMTSQAHSEKIESTFLLKGKEVIIDSPSEPVGRAFFMSPSTPFLSVKDRFGVAQRKKQIPQLISFLQQIDPNISDLRLNEIGIVEADIGLPDLLFINLMGSGIVKSLVIALSMLNTENDVVLIDEIENGLHYSAQKTIWTAIFRWAEQLNIQVFATTHSIEAARAFTSCAEDNLFKTEAMIYRVERKDEKCRVVNYAKEELAEALKSGWEFR